jgi:enterochelin esterase family protein
METMETFLDSPDMFSFVNVMSSGWFFDDEQLISDKEKKLEKAAPILLKTVKYLIFTVGGPEDVAYSNGLKTRELLHKYGIKSDYSEMPGGHTWNVWRHNLVDFAQRIFK